MQWQLMIHTTQGQFQHYLQRVIFLMYHLAPSSRGIYPIQLTNENKTDLEGQANHNEGLFRNHFFYYEDTRIKSQIRRDNISEGLAPLRSVCGTRRWHITDKSGIDPAK